MMSTNSITHVCPIAMGGVSDYVDVSIQNQPGATKLPLNQELAKSVSLSGNVLLHLSGYGFQKRGAPLWLLNKLRADRANIKTLGVFFHELYAFGPPWSSAFWLSPVQRYIARHIAELSDYWLTNREDSAVWLRRFAADKPHSVLPVFSNVGEMPSYASKRLPRVVVFGGAALRAATYHAAGDALFKWVRLQGLELHDIGPMMNDQMLNDALNKAGAVIHGKLDAHEVSDILAEASFGLVFYKAHEVAKSGVFAAYCAHGVCPILISPEYSPASGLKAMASYLPGIPFRSHSLHVIERIGCEAWSWYQTHKVEQHVIAQLNLGTINK